MSKKIIITGASGAFGGLAVNSLLKAGHKVVATMRDIETRNKAAADELSAAGALIVNMDVGNCDSVEQGMQQAIEMLGGVDVVVNNAGAGAHGIQEAFTPQQMLDLYNINVVGVHRVMRGALPTMRHQASGLIINISSLLGKISLPFYGPYSATKFALESLSETAKAELSQFGVDVALIEPGGFATSFIASHAKPADTKRLAQFGEFADIPEQSLSDFERMLKANPDQDPQRVADMILQVIETQAGTRKFRNIVDFTGMADAVEPLNEALKNTTDGLYEAFGIGHLRKLKTS
ncbi:MAG: SDR family NAD(P)-dependent oxidoreductase [Alphaproteobacteria bacterium]|nr:SDR family NAD(P)-dependent oxidoreductase [Alphaproteobacteria bacterium]